MTKRATTKFRLIEISDMRQLNHKGSAIMLRLFPQDVVQKLCLKSSLCHQTIQTAATARDDISWIDGRSFYKIVTGEDESPLYKGLPKMIRKALNDSLIKPENKDLFFKLFEQAFLR